VTKSGRSKDWFLYYHSFIRGRTFKEVVFIESRSLDWLKGILDALNAVRTARAFVVELRKLCSIQQVSYRPRVGIHRGRSMSTQHRRYLGSGCHSSSTQQSLPDHPCGWCMRELGLLLLRSLRRARFPSGTGFFSWQSRFCQLLCPRVFRGSRQLYGWSTHQLCQFGLGELPQT